MDPRFASHDFARVPDIHQDLIRDIYDRFRLYTTVKILVVVDGSISLTESPSGFGLGRVIRLLRESSIGCQRFRVDLARREGATATVPDPAANQPKYTGFRFDQSAGGSPLLDQYHEVWCFGFRPGNDAGPDSNITQPGQLPLSDGELAALTQWMNDRRGGVLAMGDHDYLGASMCHRIPRVRSMRRWTNEQNVPPIGGRFDADTHLRHDTNQPATAGQMDVTGTPDVIPFANQEDAVPQSIDWVPWMSFSHTFLKEWRRPHPVLCHPTRGPIDVMPDHPHEGWCYEDHEINLTATYSFAGYSGDEYPQVGGHRPAPMVIAHGTTTPHPPYNLDKGNSPKKKFGMVSAYNGHPAGVGRVVADSTWHHWFDENIQAIEAAGGANWDKISRYFLNVASWLAPPTAHNACLHFHAIESHFEYVGLQEYHPRATVFDLGSVLRHRLVPLYGPCWVSQWLIDHLQLVDDDIWAWLKDRLFWGKGIPGGPGGPCLSCPPLEAFEAAALGGIVRATMPLAHEVRNAAQPLKSHALMEPEKVSELAARGVAEGLGDLREALRKSVEGLKPLLR